VAARNNHHCCQRLGFSKAGFLYPVLNVRAPLHRGFSCRDKNGDPKAADSDGYAAAVPAKLSNPRTTLPNNCGGYRNGADITIVNSIKAFVCDHYG
jgi:hypothetical protein